MENSTNKNQPYQGNDKKFPGYTTEGENQNPITYTELSDAEKDERLAESGPIRNPNYHDLDDDNCASASANRYRKDNHNHKPAGTDGKTLEDYNDTEPKRDINKATNNETKDHIKS